MRSNRWKMLTGAMRGGGRWLVVAMVLGAGVATGHAQVIFTDTFDSGTGNWYQSGTAGTLTTSDNQLSWLRGSQTRETIGRSFSAQSIGVGESIRLTFDFKQNASVGILRAGLYSVGTPIAAGNWADNNIGAWSGYYTFIRNSSTSANDARRQEAATTTVDAGPCDGGVTITDPANSTNFALQNDTTYQVVFQVFRDTETEMRTLLTLSSGSTTHFSVQGKTTTVYTNFNTAVIRIENATTVLFDNIQVEVIRAVGMAVYDGATLVNTSDTVNLGTLLVDAATTRTLTVTNAASASEDLLLTNSPNAVVFANGTTSQNGFTISQNITGGNTTIAPGAASTFTISFPANTVGTHSATVRILSNDTARNPYEFTITARVVDALIPDMSVLDGATLVERSGTVDLGGVLANAVATKTLTVANSSDALADLVLQNSPNAVVFSNGTTNQNGFTITQNITGGSTTIAPGESSTFTVAFASGSVGAKSATVSIANNDPDKHPYTFTVTATVLSAPVTIGAFRFTDGSMASSDTGPLVAMSDITFGSGIQPDREFVHNGVTNYAVAGAVDNRLEINATATTPSSQVNSLEGQLGNAINHNIYFTFTVTIPKGVEADLTGLTFNYNTDNAYRAAIGVFTDKTGFVFANRLDEHYTTGTAAYNSNTDLSGVLSLQDLTDTTVEFRFYISCGGNTDDRTRYFDNIVLEGRARNTIIPGTLLIIK